MAFEVNIRQNGAVAILELQGEIEGAADAAINGAYQEAIASDPPSVLLNFAGVSYINSTGIALIVGILAEARGSGREVLACGLTDHYKEIFEITRISDFVSIYSDEGAALGAAAKS